MSDVRTLVALAALCLATACSGSGSGFGGDQGTPEQAPLSMARVETRLVLLGADKPQLSFEAVKNREVPVPGIFQTLDGALSLTPGDLAQTTGRLEVQLASLDTQNSRRDRNVREVLFGLASVSSGLAVVEVVGITPDVPGLRIGQTTVATVALKVTIRGLTVDWPAQVEITREAEARWVVVTPEPQALSLTALGLAHHVSALKALCQHQRLDDEITLTVRLVFAGSGG